MKRSILRLLLISIFFQGVAQAQPNKELQNLNNQQECIVTIAAFTAKGDQKSLSKALNEGLDSGISINEIKEILVQMYAYAGFPRSLNAINTLESVLKERQQNGVKDVEGRTSSSQKFEEGKFAFGKNVQTTLTGTTAIGSPQKFVPVIDTFLKEHLFADIFSRDVLDFKQREIATISALSCIPGTEPQLLSHLRVGRNVGLSEQQLQGIANKVKTSVGVKEGATISQFIEELYGRKSESDTNMLEKEVGQENQGSFAKGEKVKSNHFTGIVWVQMLVNVDTVFNINTGSVTFEPGARTNWHSHPGGQILLITNGTGRYQEMGKPVKTVQKGDVIKCEPDIVHWHGAAPNSQMTHIAIGTNQNAGPVNWMGPVSDEEYKQ